MPNFNSKGWCWAILIAVFILVVLLLIVVLFGFFLLSLFRCFVLFVVSGRHY